MCPKVLSSTKSLCLSSNKVAPKTSVGILWFLPKLIKALIPGKNRVFVLAGITLVLEEARLLNEYRSLFPVFQPEVLNS